MEDDLRQPLKRRSWISRILSSRPSALRAATVSSIAALAALGTWAVFSHEPYGGQPVVHMQIDTSDPIVTSSVDAPAGDASTTGAASLDAGSDGDEPEPQDLGANTEVIDLSGLGTRSDGGGETDLERAQRQLAQNRVRDDAPAESPPGALSVDELPLSRDSQGVQQEASIAGREAMALVPAPVRRLTADGPHGPLPVMAKDGSKAAQVYARPVSRDIMLSDQPKIALLIGGMGLNAELTQAAIRALPPEVSLAFAPYGENLQELANQARAQGHELFIHLPMEPFGYPSVDPGPRTLLTSAPVEQNIDSLYWHLSRFAGYAGVTNYLGAQFAANEQAIGPVLQELGKRGLVYVDDGSKGLSRATGVAGKFGLPARSATVSLDAGGNTPEAVMAALQLLEAQAQANGFAIGTGAGLPHTIDAIEEWARTLAGRRILLVPVSAAFAARQS
ncbi:MAG: divergent polysaccharide deacetylase family protein [Anderseniella sp.]|jgi:polysaccharide deacetylase 2 family uncharacterized protein YibQ|nr:divergent polysaccharide deacetylase family protein [Anderseniella sp.]